MRGRPSRWGQGCALGLVALLAGAVRAETIVTLTFDDSVEDHRQVPGLLAPTGMKATFFVISGRVGSPGYLSVEDLRALEADGHEVGGHSVSHVRLTQLAPEERREEVCEDRAQLLAWGLSPTSFAYPFGADDARTRRIVAECGYTGARDIRGLRDSCSGCPRAETIPPRRPYDVRTPETVKRYHTLADLQGWVTSAERSGGGWVVLVFHRVDERCDRQLYCVRTHVLRELVDWLSRRASLGTQVKTFREVLAGELGAAVRLPPGSPSQP